jgi:hypothetical protein
MNGTDPSARKAYTTSGKPANGSYCLGCDVPARWPAPAQGSKAKNCSEAVMAGVQWLMEKPGRVTSF